MSRVDQPLAGPVDHARPTANRTSPPDGGLAIPGAFTVKRAVIYLRVSTMEQAERDGDAEGYSIPAQRAACLRKAESLGAVIEGEFVDRGESARSANRPELQRLLRVIGSQQTDFVIVHKVDRLARSRADDVQINIALQAAGTTLVSCTENIDETPGGMLLHGIMSSIAEFYSRNLASEVIKGSVQKAMAGGTIGKAPTGYLNVRKVISGREVRTVEIDPERAPLMTWAFEQYATGEWTIRQLLEAVTAKGLTSVGGPRTPSRPLCLSNFNRLLKTPYYTGVVSYRGEVYPGLHEPLISVDTFNRVQAVLRAHDNSGEKQRVHHHYLKGTIFCLQCGSRLCVMKSKGKSGKIYPYFFCLGKQERRTSCDQSVVRIEVVEEAVERLYERLHLSHDEVESLSQLVRDEIEGRERRLAVEQTLQQRQVERLEREQEKLLQAHYADAVPLDLFRREQQRIAGQLEIARGVLTTRLGATDELIEQLEALLVLLRDCASLYRQAPDRVRRQMNQVFFTRVLVGEDDEMTHQLHEDVAFFLESPLRAAVRSSMTVAQGCREGEREEPSAPSGVKGSRKDWMVGEGGLEPPRGCPHWHLKPARLPIPPLARGAAR